MAKHYPAILACLQSIISSNDNATSKIKWKATLKAAQASKKDKYIDDLVAAENAKITALRDQ